MIKHFKKKKIWIPILIIIFAWISYGVIGFSNDEEISVQFRIDGILKDFDIEKDFDDDLGIEIEDFKIREYIKKNVVNSGVSKVMIERTTKKCFVTIYTSRPGFVIGKKGTDIEKMNGNL